MTDTQIVFGIPYALTIVAIVDLMVRDALFEMRVRRRKRANALTTERARLLSLLATRSMQRGPFR